MNEVETKTLIYYDMKRVLSRVEKEYGKIEVGTEEDYNPQLRYIEEWINDLHKKIPINDYELQDTLLMAIYDLKSYVDHKIYDYEDLYDSKTITFAKSLETQFNPFLNEQIHITEEAKQDLKGLFTLPIICLARIYDSIDFWREYYGKDGYYQMLKEYVEPIKIIGEYPYALEEKYLI